MGLYLKINAELKSHQESKVHFQPTIIQRLRATSRVCKTLSAFKFCVLWVTLTSSRKMHPICSLSVGKDVWVRTGPRPPELLWLHRAGTASNIAQRWGEQQSSMDFWIPSMGDRTAVSQWGLYTPMPSLAAKWTCCMHCHPLFNSRLNVKSTRETLAESSPTCPLTYSR